MSYKGIYTPFNPKKYVGNSNNIIYRSSWERKLFKFLDYHEKCLQWCSEEITIPYFSPLDDKWHCYFPDVLAKIQTQNGIKIFLIEIKPQHQCFPPKPTKRKTKNYYNEMNTYIINQLKWKAAKKYCKNKGWEFQILTEKILYK